MTTSRIYYSMGEVSEMLDVNPSLIRFWERKFDVIKPDKNKKGNRLFTPADVENLKLIYHLVKEKGMTLSGAEKKMKENPQGISQDMEIVDRLQGIRAMLMEIRQELDLPITPKTPARTPEPQLDASLAVEHEPLRDPTKEPFYQQTLFDL